MSYTFTHVQRFKRQPQDQSCTRCRVIHQRTRQVVVTANMKYSGTRFKLPVAYCEDHDIINEYIKE